MLELTYHWEGDYLIPDLEPPEAPRIGVGVGSFQPIFVGSN